MRGWTRARAVVGGCLLLGLLSAAPLAPSAVPVVDARGFPWRQARCAPTLHALMPLGGRVDSVLETRQGTIVALVGRPSSPVRFLPHDDLLILPRRLASAAQAGTAASRPAVRLVLPAYTTPPGLTVVETARGSAIVLVVDGTLDTFDAATGRAQARAPLGLQALGWPAAITAAADGRVYLVGQPRGAYAAVLEALTLDGLHGPRVLWRARLGLTHAGLWTGRAGVHRLAVYLPDAHDLSGTVELLDERRGALRGAYALPAPPVAADLASNRIVVQVGEALRAYALDSGRPTGGVIGAGPVAVAPARGLVAFTRGGELVLATTRALLPVAHVTLPGVTALAATADGTALLVGRRGGLWRLSLGACTARS